MKVSAPPGQSEALVPFTYGRAATELIQCRRHVGEARKSLDLALQIFSRLDENHTGVPIQSLYGVLGELEEVERALWEVPPVALAS
jgi:hypothetical protein